MAIEPVEITNEVATGRMVVDERHLHPGGFVHGGVWTAFGDSRAGCGPVLRAGGLGAELICEAPPLHVGGSTAVIEAKIRKDHHQTGSSSLRSEDPRMYAIPIVTPFVLRG